MINLRWVNKTSTMVDDLAEEVSKGVAVEKKPSEPIAFLGMTEIAVNPYNQLFTILKSKFNLRFESTVTDPKGQPIPEGIAVYVDDPGERAKVVRIRDLVLATERFKELLNQAKVAESLKGMPVAIERIVDRVLEEHPELSP